MWPTQLLIRDCGLAERLAGLRRHFCMAAGDAALFFMDTAAGELAKKADAVSVPHLQQLLGLGVLLFTIETPRAYIGRPTMRTAACDVENFARLSTTMPTAKSAFRTAFFKEHCEQVLATQMPEVCALNQPEFLMRTSDAD